MDDQYLRLKYFNFNDLTYQTTDLLYTLENSLIKEKNPDLFRDKGLLRSVLA